MQAWLVILLVLVFLLFTGAVGFICYRWRNQFPYAVLHRLDDEEMVFQQSINKKNAGVNNRNIAVGSANGKSPLNRGASINRHILAESEGLFDADNDGLYDAQDEDNVDDADRIAMEMLQQTNIQHGSGLSNDLSAADFEDELSKYGVNVADAHARDNADTPIDEVSQTPSPLPGVDSARPSRTISAISISASEGGFDDLSVDAVDDESIDHVDFSGIKQQHTNNKHS